MKKLNRRRFCKYLSAGSALAVINPCFGQSSESASTNALIQKSIPSSGQPLTVIGMGTWQTFNVGSDPELLNDRTEILDLFFQLGGELVDSSPMYGSSQEAIGYGLEKLQYPQDLFSAEKVWTRDGSATKQQIDEISTAWRVNQFDLMQVHNLVSWEEHLESLQQMKQDKQLRYVGITTSHGRRHKDLEDIMTNHEIDFVQLTYNIQDREVEERLLPLAQEKGIAVIANRPFQGGRLVDALERQKAPLPNFASDIQCENWPQFLLKYVVSHPAITCAIPATTQLQHMQENMGAAKGDLPDEAMRQQMLDYVTAL